MTNQSGLRGTGKGNNYIPADYDDLYRYYIAGEGKLSGTSLAATLIRSHMPYATEDERETLAHDVFVRIMEKDMLLKFDATKGNFGGVIFFVTRTICANYLGRKSRTPVTGLNGGSLQTRDLEDGEFEPGVYSLDRLFGGEVPAPEEAIFNRRILSELFDWAKGLYEAPRHKRDASLYPLLNLMAEQYDAQECGKELSVTPSTVHNWIGVLRDRIKEIKFALEIAEA